MTGLIYKLTCIINNKVYIGQTTEFNIRKRTHFTDSFNKNRKTYNSKISRAIRKYGQQNWKFDILCEDIPYKYLNLYEKFYINLNSSFKYEYNSTSGGNAKFNTIHKNTKRSAEVCANISKAKKGKPGKKHTKESRRKISKALKGKVRSKAHTDNLAKAQAGKKRKPHSDEVKKKMSSSHKGKVFSKEHIDKLTYKIRMRGPYKGKYKGVSPLHNGWIANITYNKKVIYLGFFNNEDDAAIVYNKAALEYFGEECYLNKVGVIDVSKDECNK